MATASKKRGPKAPVPPVPRGVPHTGKIVRLLVGQGHGLIRLANGREVFFHRADMQDGTSFNTLSVGDPVSCEVLDDRVSGARALAVARRARRRG